MSFLINIRLVAGIPSRTQIFEITRAIRAAGLVFHRGHLHGDTLVCDLSNTGELTDEIRKVAELAHQLERDCIAYYCPALEMGVLLGPRSEVYGAFDRARFVMLDGSTLAQEVLA